VGSVYRDDSANSGGFFFGWPRARDGLQSNNGMHYTGGLSTFTNVNAMQPNKDNLIWIDLEMTGLEPQEDVIIEIATIVTDKNLNTLAEGPVLAVHQSDERLAAMDDWNQQHHGASGLIDRVKAVPEGASPMCGNSICQDRRFMARLMPELEAYFHYRNLDVSTLKELVKRWAPAKLEGFKKKGTHQALDDIRESIGELQYYRETILTI